MPKHVGMSHSQTKSMSNNQDKAYHKISKARDPQPVKVRPRLASAHACLGKRPCASYIDGTGLELEFERLGMERNVALARLHRESINHGRWAANKDAEPVVAAARLIL